jgi:hypothetical protein
MDLLTTQEQLATDSGQTAMPVFIHHTSLSPVMIICYTLRQSIFFKSILQNDPGAKIIKTLNKP